MKAHLHAVITHSMGQIAYKLLENSIPQSAIETTEAETWVNVDDTSTVNGWDGFHSVISFFPLS